MRNYVIEDDQPGVYVVRDQDTGELVVEIVYMITRHGRNGSVTFQDDNTLKVELPV